MWCVWCVESPFAAPSVASDVGPAKSAPLVRAPRVRVAPAAGRWVVSPARPPVRAAVLEARVEGPPEGPMLPRARWRGAGLCAQLARVSAAGRGALAMVPEGYKGEAVGPVARLLSVPLCKVEVEEAGYHLVVVGLW